MMFFSLFSLQLFSLSENCLTPSLVQKVPYERAKCFQLEMVLGHHSMCPERERNRELNLTKFPFLIFCYLFYLFLF